jgi:hypothetical protein
MHDDGIGLRVDNFAGLNIRPANDPSENFFYSRFAHQIVPFKPKREVVIVESVLQRP